jgi:UDP-N-acetylmuramate--alanine ligase
MIAVADRIHLIGIGGAGMSGIARILLAQGVPVSGSDAKESRRLAALRALGATIVVGHEAAALDSAPSPLGIVVVSTAIPETNEERVEAHRRGIPVLSRAQALARVMEGRTGIAIAGTHGKTTTTSMLTVALQASGVDPSFAIGSELQSSGSNAHLGSGDLFVVEADESDGSFLQLHPQVAVVTNVEADHLDHWADSDQIDAAFVDFITATSLRGGYSVICVDDPGGRRLVEAARAAGCSVHTYGTSLDADFRIENWRGPQEGGSRGWSAEVVHRGVRLGSISLQVPGRHNALNATAALAVGTLLGFPVALLKEGLESFTGARRRFEFRGVVNDIRVFDDYAHHPTEVVATLTAAREIAGSGRVIVAFQSHRYSRTEAFAEEFGQALALADEVIVLEVYSAGEQAIPGASGAVIALAAEQAGAQSVVFEPSWSSIPDRISERARSGDIVMTMGAGDVGMLVPEILDRLRSAGS